MAPERPSSTKNGLWMPPIRVMMTPWAVITEPSTVMARSGGNQVEWSSSRSRTASTVRIAVPPSTTASFQGAGS